MLPIFPSFKSLSINDREEIEELTSRFLPYSDFNFVSLYIWNTENTIEISKMNSNLIVKFSDYITQKPFLSFIGKKHVSETIQKLLLHTQEVGLEPYLKLIPEECLSKEIADVQTKFKVTDDLDNYDYILDVAKIAQMKGRKLHHKRKLLNNFKKTYVGKVIVKKLDGSMIKDIINFFYIWEQQGKKSREETQNECIAIERLFHAGLNKNVHVLFAYINDKLAGYTVFEMLDNKYVVSDIQKADISYKGIYEYLNFSLASFLLDRNYLFINIEQDLGLSGLRRAKLDYDPLFLKKYKISLP